MLLYNRKEFFRKEVDTMETRRLYYENVYIKEFDAKVLKCRELPSATARDTWT